MRLTATAADLPPAVAAALTNPAPGDPGEVTTDGTIWPTTSWGDPSHPPLLLVHGVTSNAGIWWRVGPALAAAGRRVVAVDMPGHGRTAHVPRSHLLADTAAELAACIRAGGVDRQGLAVVGHSWGAAVSGHLPAAGLAPTTLVLIDPPMLGHAQMIALADDATERPYDDLDDALAAVRAENPGWSDGDVAAKALALTEFDGDLVLDVLRGNGDWEGGMAAVRDPRAASSDVWLIRGEWDTGSLIPDVELPAIEAQLGADHVVTIDGAPHSPQRTHPEATILAILRAIA